MYLTLELLAYALTFVSCGSSNSNRSHPLGTSARNSSSGPRNVFADSESKPTRNENDILGAILQEITRSVNSIPSTRTSSTTFTTAGETTLSSSTTAASTSTATSGLSALATILPKSIRPSCANAISASLEDLATSSCSQTTVSLILDFLGETNLISSSSLLGNLPQMCTNSCISGLEKFLQILQNSNQCANQIVGGSMNLGSGGNGILGSKAADILAVFSKLSCVKDPENNIKFCLNYPEQAAYISQALKKPNRSVQDTLLDLAKNRTDITCSPCGIAQQTAIVRLNPMSNISSQDIKYGVVAGIAKIQESCELRGIPKQQIASSSIATFVFGSARDFFNLALLVIFSV